MPCEYTISDIRDWDSVRRKTAFQIWECENCGSTVACSWAVNRESLMIGIAPDVPIQEVSPDDFWKCIDLLMTNLCCKRPRYTPTLSAKTVVELKNTPIVEKKQPRVDWILEN